MESQKCMYKNCKIDSPRKFTRGLCATHYNSACGLVRRKKITWAILVKHGMAAKPSLRRRDMSDFTKDTLDIAQKETMDIVGLRPLHRQE